MLAKKTILVVEDELDIRNLLQLYLEREYEVLTAENGKYALQVLQQKQPDLVLLDILLPEMNGLDVCKKIRERDKEVPILFLSCKRESEDKIYGLDVGGDDYITKPFDPAELLARVKANLRRSHVTNIQNIKQTNILQFGSLKIELDSYSVLLNDRPVSLYAKERQLLLLLAKRPNQVFSTEQLYDQIWGIERFGDLKTVLVHISNLRKKIEQNPAKPKYILTVRGFGYKFNSNS